MRKANLLNSGVLEATLDMINAAKADIPQEVASYGRKYKTYKYSWYIRSRVVEIKGEQILKTGIYRRKDLRKGVKEPAYTVFLSREENKYLTYNHSEEKWSMGKIDSYDYDGSYCVYPKEKYYSKETEKVVCNYLQTSKKSPYEAILSYQNDIKAESLRRTHKKETDRIDGVMERVSELPKDFNHWIENTAMQFSRYIYYEYSRNVQIGYCTHCKKEVKISKPKHNQKGKCTSCRSNVTFKAIKKAATVYDKGYATILQRLDDGFILRYFEIYKNYNDFKYPVLNVFEAIRITVNEQFYTIGEYEFTDYKHTGVNRWCKWESGGWNNSRVMYQSAIYDKNLKRLLEGTSFQYSALDIFAKVMRGSYFHLSDYINTYKTDKFLEYMVKAGLYNIVSTFIRNRVGDYHIINGSGKRLHEVLKVNKDQIKTLVEMNASYTELRVLQMANEAGVNLTKEQIRWIADNIGRSSLISYMRFTTAHKMIRYLKELLKSTSTKITNIANDYYDYLDISEKLGYDLNNSFIFYPRNLIQSHDLVVKEKEERDERIKKMQDDERNILMAEMADELIKAYAMKDKHFTIRIPWTCEEIRQEGHALRHCVGTYIERVLKKETIILFIRKLDEVDKPFYTMEVKEGRINQVRGKNNEDTTPEVQAFVDKFKAKKLNIMREAV